MIWLREHWLHLLFVLAYLAVLVRHAWIGKQKTHSLDDYLVAGRGLGGMVVALSFYATFMSTNTFMGAAGESWERGLMWCVGGVVLVGCCCASWFLVAPRFVPLARQYDSLTVADFLGYHYRSMLVRKFAAAIIFLASILYLVAIYRGSAIALEELLHVPYALAAVLVFFVVTAYTLAGGFSSVVLTDAMQGSLMFVGAVAILAAVLVRGGGPAAVMESLARENPAMVSWQGGGALVTILGLQLAVGIKYLVEPRQLSRFYGLRDAAALRLAARVTPLLVIVTYVCLLPIGALAHALIPAHELPGGESDRVIAYLLSTVNIFGPVFSSLFLLVLLSAAMSSIDSVLLVAASSVDHDLIAPGAEDARAIARTRVWIVVISLLSMGCALLPQADDIVTITAFSGSLYGACFLPALVIGLFWQRGTPAGALAGIVCGSVSVVGWFIARQYGWVRLHEVYIGLAVGTLSYLLVSLFTRRAAASETS